MRPTVLVAAICALAMALLCHPSQALTSELEARVSRLEAQIADRLGMDVALEGIENCANKCEKIYQKFAYAILNQENQLSFEYRSCLLGCNQCQRQLNNPNLQEDTCFRYCKTLDYSNRGIRKGVIEPDKACLVGCVINTCQEVCFGGTTDNKITPRNQHLWWGLGGNGCSLKMGLGYVQSPLYGNPDGPGITTEQRKCCTNAFNLCFYVGDESSVNFQNVVLVAQRSCSPYVSSTSREQICAFYNNPQNCGTQGLQPLLVTSLLTS